MKKRITGGAVSSGTVRALVSLRGGRIEDASMLARLIWESDGGILRYLVGGDIRKLEQLICSFSKKRRTIFSCRHMIVAHQKNNIFGVLYGYDSDIIFLTRRYTFFAFFRVLGFLRTVWMLPTLIMLGWKTRIGNDEFYVSNLAVTEDSRRLGIGSRLMTHREQFSGKTKVVLDVATHNGTAIQFYEKLGYHMVRTWRFRKITYMRMAKVL